VLLLDTHAAVWLYEGLRMRRDALEATESARWEGGVLVSAVTAWELGNLVSRGRLRLNLRPSAWMHRLLDLPGVRLAPLTVEAAAEAAFLPQPFPGDPADRLLVTTARELGAPLVTRDRAIIAFADLTGSVRVVRC
jgi:PIN domain nuclease of toxin-antitoxin system